MNVQRVGVRALRQAAARQPSTFSSHNVPRIAMAGLQARGASTTNKITSHDASTLLASQRAARPVSPHMTIYDYNQVWLGASIWTRITGLIFTGGLYGFGAAYLVAPLAGWHLESASLAAAFGALSPVLKGGVKFLAAWPFVFHAMSGARHFVWDFARGMGKNTIHKSSWAIWGASLVTALGLGFFV
ncbi:hypothetical protein GGR56DRAFT_654432 [Xylariaceae sp. FL0804]|nr:hypothetical protein GGR56DRAFT_654432 [Xylariaceae sp. FL0804]